MKLAGNIIWLIFGGLLIFIEYIISSCLLLISIIGIPFGLQTLKLAILTLSPFGSKVLKVKNEYGCLTLFFNVIWILIGGFWIFLSHLFFGCVLFITIIGIPFAKQHFKLARLALLPFGKEIV